MSDLDKGRAFYDYTFSTMKYDKTGTGWGRGDTLWACDAKHGNCTDFIQSLSPWHVHRKFQRVLKWDCHCRRAEFWTDCRVSLLGGVLYPRTRLVPGGHFRSLEAPGKKDYFFGAHDVNRVQFSVGRDLQLSPAQHGDRVNYLIFPYVELGGEPCPTWPMRSHLPMWPGKATRRTISENHFFPSAV